MATIIGNAYAEDALGLFSDVLLGGGWTISYSSSSVLVAAMGDALQSIAPVHIRVDYTTTPSFEIRFGTGSNSSALLGPDHLTSYRFRIYMRSPYVSLGYSNMYVTRESMMYASAGPARLTMALTHDYYNMWIAVERSKDANGGDTGDGLILSRFTYVNNVDSGEPITYEYLRGFSRYARFEDEEYDKASTMNLSWSGFHCLVSTAPGVSNSPLYTLRGNKLMNPGINVVLGKPVGENRIVTRSLYGIQRSYLTLPQSAYRFRYGRPTEGNPLDISAAILFE